MEAFRYHHEKNKTIYGEGGAVIISDTTCPDKRYMNAAVELLSAMAKDVRGHYLYFANDEQEARFAMQYIAKLNSHVYQVEEEDRNANMDRLKAITLLNALSLQGTIDNWLNWKVPTVTTSHVYKVTTKDNHATLRCGSTIQATWPEDNRRIQYSEYKFVVKTFVSTPAKTKADTPSKTKADDAALTEEKIRAIVREEIIAKILGAVK